MGASAGPSLAGIGRGGASNLVLEMDAHDAKSYPGEPTTNTLLNGYFPGTDTTTVTAGWTLHGTAAIRTYRPAAEEFFYKNLGLSNPRVFQINGGGWYNDSGSGYTRIGMPNPTPGFSTSTATTVSFWYRFTGQNAAQLSNQYIWFDFDYGLANLAAINYTDYNDTEWHFYSATQTSSGSYAYYNLYIYANYLSNCPGGSYFEIGALQIEQKGYATPFVGDGQFARPATTNLMIHGNVGTGQSFSDSSPSGHTITANGDVTHSGGQSKFSGGSIYFDGNGDYLSIPDSADWSFGSDDFTVDAWIYVSAFDGYHVIMGQDDDSTQRGWHFRTQVTSGDLLFRYSTTGSNETDISSSSTGMVINTWYHVAFVRASDTYAFYVNGVQKGSGSLTATFHASSTTMMVGARAGADLWFEGYMDEARITKGTALWGGAFTPPTRRNLSAPVVDRVNYNGLNCASTLTTNTATYRVGEVIRPIASAYWDFDGTDDKFSGGVANFDPTGPATINLWLNQDSGNNGITTCLGNASASDRYFNIHPSNTSLMRMGVVSSGGWQYKTFTDNLLGTWAMLTIVNTGSSASPSTYSVYLNGTAHADNPVTYTGSFSDPTDLFVLGNYTLNNNYDTDGQIANVQIYKVALTPQQVKENFNQQRNRFKI